MSNVDIHNTIAQMEAQQREMRVALETARAKIADLSRDVQASGTRAQAAETKLKQTIIEKQTMVNVFEFEYILIFFFLWTFEFENGAKTKKKNKKTKNKKKQKPNINYL